MGKRYGNKAYGLQLYGILFTQAIQIMVEAKHSAHDTKF